MLRDAVCGFSLLAIIAVSSANVAMTVSFLVGMSVVNIRCRRGPNTLPWLSENYVIFVGKSKTFFIFTVKQGRLLRLCGLRSSSEPPGFLGSRDQIPLRAWAFFSCVYVCCLGSGPL